MKMANFREIICQKCAENIRIKIKDYIISLFECNNNHCKNNILLSEYPIIQKNAKLKLICGSCSNIRQKNDNYYRCNTCNVNLCANCKFNHIKTHSFYNYGKQYMSCIKHSKNYSSYCNKCKKNLCKSCENGHNSHDIVYFKDLIFAKDETSIRNELNELRTKIDNLKGNINKMIKMLKKVVENMDNYYQINLDIISDYLDKDITYIKIQNMNCIKDYNINVKNDIDQIINDNDLNNKFKNILIMYNKMKSREIGPHHKIKIKYKLDKNMNQLRLFGSNFVLNNKDIAKILYENEEYELKEEITIKNCMLNKDTLEIDLIFVDNIIKMIDMFDKCDNLISLSDMSNLDTSSVVSMHGIFANCSSLLFLPEISKWNISNVTDMSWMFYNCKSLTTLPDISIWNISNVNDISGMFSDCSSLIWLPDISKWNTNNIKYMHNLFNGCSSLLTLPDISKWDISNVNNLNGMFSDCSSLSKIPDISKWNTSNVTDLGLLFGNCSSLRSLPDISKWNTKKVYNINYIFNKCLSLSYLPDISKWNISRLIGKENPFFDCISLLSLPKVN